MGFELAFLSLGRRWTPLNKGQQLTFIALALGQLSTKVIAFQWVFAFIIMACLIILSLGVGIPGLFGSVKTRAEGIVDEDRERAPLLEDQ